MKDLLEKLEQLDNTPLNELNLFGNKVYADEINLIQAEAKLNEAYKRFIKIYKTNNPLIAELAKDPRNKKLQDKITKRIDELELALKNQLVDMYKSVNLHKIRKDPVL